jgi:hypothetical protein
MQLINCTPHTISLIVNNQTFNLAPSGVSPRIKQERISSTFNTQYGSIPLTKVEMGELVGLPEPADNTLYIVSLLVLEAGKKKGRSDLVAPDTVRDDKGNIIGCSGFIQ